MRKKKFHRPRSFIALAVALVFLMTSCFGTMAVFAETGTEQDPADPVVTTEEDPADPEPTDPTPTDPTPANPEPTGPEPDKPKPLPKVSAGELRKMFNQSVFVGNSVQRCKKLYFDKKGGKKRFGNPLFLVRVRYSFLDDRKRYKPYMIRYKKRTMRAKDAIKRSGKKYVFISMGQNDMRISVYTGFQNYIKYLNEIHKTCPKKVIFVEAMTPMRKPLRLQTQTRYDRMNYYIKAYCQSKSWVYFIDTSTPLKGKDNLLQKRYSRDNYIHLNPRGSAAWAALDQKFMKKYLQYKKAGRLKELEPLQKMPRLKKKKQERHLVKKGKVMYYSDGVMVKGTVFYKGKFYVYPKKGKYSKKKSAALNKAMKKKNLKKLRKLLGKPSKSIYEPSCAKNGKDGILIYNRGFTLITFKYPKGKEILIDVEASSVVDYL